MANINELLVNTLSRHGPVFPDFYEGEEEKYITFNYPDEVPELFGNNRPHKTMVYVQVHLFLPDNMVYQSEKKQICKELKSVGFSYPDVTILHEKETEKRHIVFETKIKTTIEWEE